jgi:hypothetical protein
MIFLPQFLAHYARTEVPCVVPTLARSYFGEVWHMCCCAGAPSRGLPEGRDTISPQEVPTTAVDCGQDWLTASAAAAGCLQFVPISEDNCPRSWGSSISSIGSSKNMLAAATEGAGPCNEQHNIPEGGVLAIPALSHSESACDGGDKPVEIRSLRPDELALVKRVRFLTPLCPPTPWSLCCCLHLTRLHSFLAGF